MDDEAMSNGYAPKEAEKSWERPWTLDEMRQKSHNWSLASDAGMLQYLQSFSQRLLNRTHQIQEEVNGLIHESKLTGVRIGNTFNDFIMLANTQFVENRVYDEDVSTTTTSENGESDKSMQQEKSKEEKEGELIPRLAAAVREGMSVIDTAFERLEVNEANSDSEEDTPYKTDALLEPKDPYLTRPLPHIIGTQAFNQDDDVGLIDTLSDDETLSDHGSLSQSDASEIHEAPVPHHSDSSSDYLTDEDEDDLFGGTSGVPHTDSEEDSFSDEQTEQTDDFAAELGAKLGIKAPGDKASERENHQKDRTKKHKPKQSVEAGDDPFAPPPDEGEDSDDLFTGQDSMFAPKQGIFSSNKGLFDDDEDQDIPQRTKVTKKKMKQPQVTDVSSRSSLSSLGREEEARHHRPQTDNLFAVTRDGPSKKSSAKTDVPPLSVTNSHASSHSLFDKDQDEDSGDLFGQKSKEVKPRQTAASLFDDEDEVEEDGDIFADLGKSKSNRNSSAKGKDSGVKKREEKKLPAGAVSMFGGAGNPLKAGLQQAPTSTQPKTSDIPASQKSEQDLFDESSKPDSDEDLFAAPARKVKQPPPVMKKESLFVDDDDDDDDDEDDLFSSLSRPPPVRAPVSRAPQRTAPVKKVSLFGESPPDAGDLFTGAETTRQQQVAPNKVSLFGDDEDASSSNIPPKVVKQKKASGRMLFEEDEPPQTEEPEVDLFGPSSPLASPKTSLSNTGEAGTAAPGEQITSPLSVHPTEQPPTAKKMPPGAVSMFGGSTGQLTAALQAGHHVTPEEPSHKPDDEDGLFTSESIKAPPPSVSRVPLGDQLVDEDQEDDLPDEKTASVKLPTAKKPPSAEKFALDDQEDDLFSEKSHATKLPPPTARKPPNSKPPADEDDALFTEKPQAKLPPATAKKHPSPDLSPDQESDLFSVKSHPAKIAPPTARKPATEPLTDPDQDHDLFAQKSHPVKETDVTKKHLPAGAVSMFGGAPNPLLGALKAKTAKHKEEEREESGGTSPPITSHDVKSHDVNSHDVNSHAVNSHETSAHDTFFNTQAQPSSVSGGSAASDSIIDLDHPTHVDTLPSMVKHRARTNTKRRPPSRLIKSSAQPGGPLSPQSPTDVHDPSRSFNTTASSAFDSYDRGPSHFDEIFRGEVSKPALVVEDEFTKPQPPPLLDNAEDDDFLSSFKTKQGFIEEDDFFDITPVVPQTQPAQGIGHTGGGSGSHSATKKALSVEVDVTSSLVHSKPSPLPDNSTKTTWKPSPLPDDDLFTSSDTARKRSPLPNDDLLPASKTERKPSPLPDDHLFASSKTAQKQSTLPDDDFFPASKATQEPSALLDDALFTSSKTARKQSPLPNDLLPASKTVRKPSPLPDDDLFPSSKTAQKQSPVPGDDLSSASKMARKPSPLPDDDIFNNSQVPVKSNAVDEDDIFDISILSSKPPLSPITDDIFTSSKVSSKTQPRPEADDDIFNSLSTPNSVKALETDDIFSSLPPSSKSTTSKVKAQKDEAFSAKKTSTPSKPPVDDIFATPSVASNQPPVDDDIFSDSTKPPPTITESDDIFAPSNIKKESASKASTSATGKDHTGKKFRPKKAKTKDEDLFADDTDIFATTTKTEKSKKSKAKSTGDPLFKTGTDDIFASSTKSVKTSKKKTHKPAPPASAAKTEDIFDDPLSAFNN